MIRNNNKTKLNFLDYFLIIFFIIFLALSLLGGIYLFFDIIKHPI